MSTTTPAAEDAMFGAVAAVLGSLHAGLHIEWPGVQLASGPPQDSRWARVAIDHKDSGQASLSCEHGQKRWGREGQLHVQIFVPFAVGGRQEAMRWACAVRDHLQSADLDGGVWLRDINAKDVGPDRNWYNTRVHARFYYDEVN